MPEWSGRWRTIEVRVGIHCPPPAHLLPQLMRDYTDNLQARLAGPGDLDLILEHLAYAEGRLLSIHPFRDFNGRLVRLWLWETLRRLRLPPVELAPMQPAATATYLEALRACDAGDYRPLAGIWGHRLAHFS